MLCMFALPLNCFTCLQHNRTFKSIKCYLQSAAIALNSKIASNRSHPMDLCANFVMTVNGGLVVSSIYHTSNMNHHISQLASYQLAIAIIKEQLKYPGVVKQDITLYFKEVNHVDVKLREIVPLKTTSVI